MANPIAASAAATVNINRENKKPIESSKLKDEKTKFKLIDNKINSIDIKVNIKFFRDKKIPLNTIRNNIKKKKLIFKGK